MELTSSRPQISTLYQHQYVISPRITTPGGFTIMPVFHLINIHFMSPVVLSQGYQGGSSQIGLLILRPMIL